jgi:hypothetical protein
MFYLFLFFVLFGLGTGSPSGEKKRMCVLVKEVLWAIFRPMSYEITVTEKSTYEGDLELIIHIQLLFIDRLTPVADMCKTGGIKNCISSCRLKTVRH